MLKADQSDLLESLTKENSLFEDNLNTDFEEYRINNSVFLEELLYKLNNLILNLDRCDTAEEFLIYLKLDIYFLSFFIKEQFKIKKQDVKENDFLKINLRYAEDNNFKEVLRNIISYLGDKKEVNYVDACHIFILLDCINDNININFSFEEAYMLLAKLESKDKNKNIFYKHYISKGSKLKKEKSASNIVYVRDIVYKSLNEFKKLDNKEISNINEFIKEEQALLYKASLKIYFEEFKVGNAEKKLKKPEYFASGRIGTIEFRIDDRFYLEEKYRLNNFVSNIDFKL